MLLMSWQCTKHFWHALLQWEMIWKRSKVQSVCEKWVDPGVYFIDAINTTVITEFYKEFNSYSKHKAFFFKISLVETQT